MPFSRINRGTSNRLLLALPRPVLERLRHNLEPVELERRQVLFHVHSPLNHLYFVEEGLISLVRTMQDGRTVEVGAVGIEGAAGGNAIIGVRHALFDMIVQVPGKAQRISWHTLRSELMKSTVLRDLLQRYAHYGITQLAQNAACNRLHSLEARCCRWLLIAHDNVRSDSFPLTHEVLAMMLGVQRTGVSLATTMLQQSGLIRSARGRVFVTDRPGLEAAACECYGALRSELDDLFGASALKLIRQSE
jgi:CRP-like cAMP-binding protein